MTSCKASTLYVKMVGVPWKKKQLVYMYCTDGGDERRG